MSIAFLSSRPREITHLAPNSWKRLQLTISAVCHLDLKRAGLFAERVTATMRLSVRSGSPRRTLIGSGESAMPVAVRYLCSVRLDGVHRIFLWDSGADGSDQVVLDERGMVLEFASESAAREARPPAGRVLSPEPATHYDFDSVQAWCASTSATLDCATLR